MMDTGQKIQVSLGKYLRACISLEKLWNDLGPLFSQYDEMSMEDRHALDVARMLILDYYAGYITSEEMNESLSRQCRSTE